MFRFLLRSKSRRFYCYCLAFLSGIALISIIDRKVDFFILYLLYFFLITAILIFWNNDKVVFVVFCFLALVSGIVRYLLPFPPESPQFVANYNGQSKQIGGYICAEPDIRLDGARYILKVEKLEGAEKIKGKVYLKYDLYPRFDYGDYLRVSCSLRQPEIIESINGRDFRYDMYLARYGVFSICRAEQVKKYGNKGNVLLKKIFALKKKVAEKVNKLWHEPHASFMAGLLYGYRGGLGSLNELFNITGVTHIVAISGYNISIIAAIFISISVNLYIPKKKAFPLVAIGIIIFVVFAGASASVMRAGIMGIMVLFVKHLGTISRVGNVMILTCVLMCLFNPFVLIWDAGFQLSFISTLGLIYLTPLLERRVKFIPEFFSLRESFISTISAIIATLPLILFQFGRLSLVAPLVNVLILWILPLLMALGFFAVLASYVFLPLAQVLAWTAWLGLSYIIIIVKWFASLNYAAINILIPAYVMMLCYAVMTYSVYRAHKKEQPFYSIISKEKSSEKKDINYIKKVK